MALELIELALRRGEYVDDHGAVVDERPVGVGAALASHRTYTFRSELLGDSRSEEHTSELQSQRVH
jgi:hypothetical protein